MPMSALVRWESAKLVQQAETRLHSAANADSKPAENPFGNHYVVSVIGLRVSGSQSGWNRDQSDGDSGNRNRSSDSARDQLMSSAQLILKNRAPITPDDVKINTQNGENEIQFFFPKTSSISLDDKEATFQTMVGRLKVENKFNLKKMTRNGKLELD